MDSILNFFSDVLITFTDVGNWFFNAEILGTHPVNILLFGGVITILALWVYKLIF